MSDTQHTADELRKEADNAQEVADRYVAYGVSEEGVAPVKVIASMLRAGADAMELADYRLSEWIKTNAALAKAEARVKELEGVIDAIVKYPRVSITIGTELYNKARAVLQVKP